MRNQVLAIAARVEAARDLLEMARRHIGAAAHEDDTQHSAALLSLGGALADFAELILRNVNDGRQSLQKMEAEVTPQQPATRPGGRWFHWQEQDSGHHTATNGDYSGILWRTAAGWRLDIFRNGSVICRREFSQDGGGEMLAYGRACDFAENLMESLKNCEEVTP